MKTTIRQIQTSPYSAIQVARHYIRLAELSHSYVNNLSLQKILFWTQIFFIQELNRSCFCATVESSGSGVLVPEVFNSFPPTTLPISSKEGCLIPDIPFEEETIFWTILEHCLPLTLSQLNETVYTTDIWKDNVINDRKIYFTESLIRRYYPYTKEKETIIYNSSLDLDVLCRQLVHDRNCIDKEFRHLTNSSCNGERRNELMILRNYISGLLASCVDGGGKR